MLIKKTFRSLFWIYVIQLLIMSCEDDCSCSPGIDEINYNGLIVNAWDTSGFQISEVDDVVNKNSFGITISIKSEIIQIASNLQKTNFSGLGFASTYACSCAPNKYITVDPISAVTITVTDIQTKEITDVTNNFTAYGNTVEELIRGINENEPYEYHYSEFELEMTVYDTIPDTSIFTVTVILESGKEFIEQTQEIIFE